MISLPPIMSWNGLRMQSPFNRKVFLPLPFTAQALQVTSGNQIFAQLSVPMNYIAQHIEQVYGVVLHQSHRKIFVCFIKFVSRTVITFYRTLCFYLHRIGSFSPFNSIFWYQNLFLSSTLKNVTFFVFWRRSWFSGSARFYTFCTICFEFVAECLRHRPRN